VSSFLIRRAAQIVRSGGIIAYPTEAVFGLGCDPLNTDAIQRLLVLKDRRPDKGLILIASDFGQLRPYVEPLSDDNMQPIHASWPGPHTWLLPKSDACPCLLSGAHDTLAVRVTAHPIAASLCRALGSPLVSTSANRASQSPARTQLQVRLRFGYTLDMILGGEADDTMQPTGIRDAATGNILRASSTQETR